MATILGVAPWGAMQEDRGRGVSTKWKGMGSRSHKTCLTLGTFSEKRDDSWYLSSLTARTLGGCIPQGKTDSNAPSAQLDALLPIKAQPATPACASAW